MSVESREAFDKFTDEQIAILDKANSKITDNVIAHHKEFCDEPNNDCEALYVEVFVMSFREKLRAKNAAARNAMKLN